MAIPSAYEYLKHLMKERGGTLIDATVLAVNGALVDVRIAGSSRTLKSVPLAEHVYTDRLVAGAPVSLGLHQTQPFVAAIHMPPTGETPTIIEGTAIPRPSLRVTAEETGFQLTWRVPHSEKYRYEVYGNIDDSGNNPVLLDFTYQGITDYLHLYDDTLIWFAVRAVQRDGQRGPLSAWVSAAVSALGQPNSFTVDDYIDTWRLSWYPPTGEVAYEYRIEWAKDDQGTDAETIIVQAATEPAVYKNTAEKFADDPDYTYFRVTALTIDGVAGTPTDWTTDNVAPNPPQSMQWMATTEGYWISWDLRDWTTFPPVDRTSDLMATGIYVADTRFDLDNATLVTWVDTQAYGATYTLPYDPTLVGKYLCLRCMDHAGNISSGGLWAGTPLTAEPAAPSSVTVAAMPGGFEVNWGESVGAASYQVEWASDDQGSDAEICFTGNVLGKFDAADGLHTWFRVRAVGFDGSYSAWTDWAQDGTPPPQVTGFSVNSSIEGGNLLIDLSTDTSHSDPSFRRWQIFTADDDQGTNAAFFGYMLEEEATGKWIDQAGNTTVCYALKAEDWAGNLSTYSAWVALNSLPRDYGPIEDSFDGYGGDDVTDTESLFWLNVTSCDSGQTWTKVGAGTVEIVATPRIEGDGSLKMSSNAGAKGFTTFSPALDLSQDSRFGDDDYVVVAVYPDRFEQADGFSIRFWTDTDTDSMYYKTLFVSDVTLDEWNFLKIKKSEFTANNSPDWSSIEAIGFYIYESGIPHDDPIVYVDDLRIVKADPDDGSVPNDTGIAWDFEGGEWHIYEGQVAGEPDKPFALGQVSAVSYASATTWYTAHHTQSDVARGVLVAGTYTKDNDGQIGVLFNIQDATPATRTCYGVELEPVINAIRLVKWVNGARTSLAQHLSFSFDLDENVWVGVDWRDPDRINVYVSKVEGNVIQAENLIISLTDTAVARGGPVGVMSKQANCRFFYFRAGSPAHAMTAEFAYAAETARAIQGRRVADVDPADGQVLAWDNGQWEPSNVPSHTHTESQITDLDHDATKLQGRTVGSTAPSNGQVLSWNGSQWEPVTPSGGGTITGEIRMWPTASPPSGWLLCQGQALSTTTYASLFSVIGYTFGGSGSTFYLPNFQGKSPQGVDGSDGVGAARGTKMQTQVPQHTHSYSIYRNGSGDGTNTEGTPAVVATATQYTSYTGSPGGVDQRGPRLAVYFIIKT